MLEVIRDPSWQFVGVILAILAIFASIAIYRLQKLNKKLSYEILARTNLLTHREELENKIQVLYDGNPVQALTVFVIRIWNAGREPIRSDDFERPLSFHIVEPAEILTVAVTAISPESLNPQLSFETRTLTVSPLLLNPKDTLTIKVLVSDASALSMKPDARIVGISRIQEGDGASRRFALLTGLGMLMFFAGVVVAAFNSPKPVANPPMPLISKTAIGIAIVGYLFAGYGFVRSGALTRISTILVRMTRMRLSSA